MNVNRIVISFIAYVTSLGLSGWSLASPAAAATIVVNTNQDTVDPPFNAPGLCGSGTVADLPGTDGKVSLREAVIAANNTPGQKTITFAPSLSGNTIVLTRSLYLCGEHTTLNGDVNEDDTPDITVDGSAVLPPRSVIGLVSSHNTVKNLRVLAPNNSNVQTISIFTTLAVATTVMDNTIAHNIVSGAIRVAAGFDEFNNAQSSINAVTIKHTIVRDNTVVGNPFGILAFNVGAHNVITDLTIAGNTVSGTTGIAGIFVAGGLQNSFDPNDTGATNNRLDVTIKDNTSTGNSAPGDIAGIEILGGLFSSSRNQVAAQVLNNTIMDNTGTGIAVISGVVDSSGNHTTADLLDNTITDNNGAGIIAIAGNEVSSDNHMEVRIRGNTVENNAGPGILTLGAIGAGFSPAGDSSGNTLDARIERNTVKNAFLFGIWVNSGIGSFDGLAGKVANDNEVNAVVTDNTVTGTTGEGMHLDAGGSGEANDNDADVAIKKNTVCGNTDADIHAIGGLLGNPFLLDNTGTGNELEGEITKNTATTVVVEDGVTGNSADVAQSKNVPCP